MKIFLSLLFQKYGFSEEGQKLRSEIVCPSLLRIGVCCMQATMSSGSKISTDYMVVSPRSTRSHWHHMMPATLRLNLEMHDDNPEMCVQVLES